MCCGERATTEVATQNRERGHTGLPLLPVPPTPRTRTVGRAPSGRVQAPCGGKGKSGGGGDGEVGGLDTRQKEKKKGDVGVEIEKEEEKIELFSFVLYMNS